MKGSLTRIEYLLLILVSVVVRIHALDQCRIILSNSDDNHKKACTCLESREGIEITCDANTVVSPPDDFSNESISFEYAFSANYNRRRSLELKCGNPNWTKYIHSWNLGGYVPNLTLENCLFVESDSLKNILQEMNISASSIESSSMDLPASMKALPESFLDGLSSLELLIVKNSDLETLNSRVFRDSVKLKHLNLYGNRLSSSLDFIESLPSLQILHLGSNRLKEIRLQESFHKVSPNFSFLGLSSNNIRRLDAHTFRHWSNLTILDLSSNNLIDPLPEALFDTLTKLKNLTLVKSNISSLPASLFANLTALQRLDLQSNLFQNLPESLFESLTQLVELNLGYCNLTLLYDKVFASLTNLRILNLEKNRLKSLPSNILAGTSKLRQLRLSGNRLSSLPANLLVNCEQLEALHLDQNLLTVLNLDFSSQRSRLKIIHLQHNQLHTVNADEFMRLETLEEADLSFNNLTLDSTILPGFGERQSMFRYSVDLRLLNLANNRIADWFSDWNNMGKLEVLNLSRNLFSYIQYSSDLSVFPDDVQVDLRHNPLKQINFENFQFTTEEGVPYTQEKTLFLGNNSLNCDCQTLDFAKYLQKSPPATGQNSPQYLWDIVTDQNLFCVSPEGLRGRNPALLRLTDFQCSLSVNQGCPKGCRCQRRPVDSTILADCGGTNLTDLGNLTTKMHKLPSWYKVELNLSHNAIESLDWLSDPKSDRIAWLALDYNHLTFNRTNWTNLNLPPNLNFVSLVGNRFDSWSTPALNWLNRTLANRTNLRLELRGNPWICECAWYRFFTENPIGNQIDQGDISCYLGSRSQQSIELKLLTIANVCDTRLGIAAMVAIVFALLAVLAAVCTVLSYRYRRSLLIWLYAKGWCLSCITESEVDDDKLYDAFVSYSHKDEDFVLEELVPRLEGGKQSQHTVGDPELVPTYRLCLHYRDWLAGEWIPEQITRSVSQSRRTIVILSEHFVESVWGRLEFRTAYSQALEDKHNRLIIVVRGELPSTDSMDKELVDYLKLNTYLKWGDPWFWQRLRYALPHQTTKNSSRSLMLAHSHDPKLASGNLGKGLPPLPLRKDDKVQLVGVNIELTPTTTPSPSGHSPPNFDLKPIANSSA